LTTTPQDTLHYLSAKKDYEGLPSSKGVYNVFSVDETLINTGAATAARSFGKLKTPSWIFVDTIVAGVRHRLPSANQAQAPHPLPRVAGFVAAHRDDHVHRRKRKRGYDTMLGASLVVQERARHACCRRGIGGRFYSRTKLPESFFAHDDDLVPAVILKRMRLSSFRILLGRNGFRTLVNGKTKRGRNTVVVSRGCIAGGNLYTYRVMTKIGVQTGKICCFDKSEIRPRRRKTKNNLRQTNSEARKKSPLTKRGGRRRQMMPAK